MNYNAGTQEKIRPEHIFCEHEICNIFTLASMTALKLGCKTVQKPQTLEETSFTRCQYVSFFMQIALLHKSYNKITNNKRYLIMGTSNNISTSYYTIWQPTTVWN
jgi:hypothetical protein